MILSLMRIAVNVSDTLRTGSEVLAYEKPYATCHEAERFGPHIDIKGQRRCMTWGPNKARANLGVF